MIADAADRFSDVPDQVLLHVISFLPVRDAARTAVLSRRWRPLWLRAPTVNLDSRSYHGQTIYYGSVSGNLLFRDAAAALAAPGRHPPRALFLFVKGNSSQACQAALVYNRYMDVHNRLQDLLVGEPSLQELEELRVGFEFRDDRSLRYIMHLRAEILPARTIRVLDLTMCCLELPPRSAGAGASASFSRLASLRLVRCHMSKHHLESLTRAAPSLAVLCIQDHDFYDPYPYDVSGSDGRFALHCPNLTSLTVAGYTPPVEVYAPRLRDVAYNGPYTEFLMGSDATNLTRASLKFKRKRYDWHDRKTLSSRLLWQCLGSLCRAKALSLRLPSIKDLVVDDDEGVEDGDLPVLLHGLERLELEAALDADDTKDAAAAIAALLRRCPVIRHLQLRIKAGPHRDRCYTTSVPCQFDVSVDLFNRRESEEIALLIDGDGDGESSVPDLPGLTGCWFSCLQSHLKYVKLQFELEEPNSFEVCLAKFLAENCKVLEVFEIEDGDQHFLGHINNKVERWRLHASKQQSDFKRIGTSDASINK